MSTHRLSRDRRAFGFDAGAAPALTIDPGDRVVIETYDCFTNKIDSPDQVFERDSDLMALIGQFNPVTGPIYVRGAQPGDRLAVSIEAIELGTLAPYAVTVLTKDQKGLCGNGSPRLPVRPDTRICRLTDTAVLFPTSRGELPLPLRPMVGSVGTAPATGGASSLEFGRWHGGNVDCPDLTVGAVLQLPVNVPGGLLWLGDVHAAMGDAEVTGTALETNADVTVTVELLPGSAGVEPAGPWLDTPGAIGSIGCEFGASLTENLHHAFAGLHTRIVDGFALDPIEAYELLGAGARVTVNQCVAGGWTAARVRLGLDHLPPPLTDTRSAGSTELPPW